MARLLRPYIPLSVRVEAAERQFNAMVASDGSFNPEKDIAKRNRAVFRDCVDRVSWKVRSSLRRQLDMFLQLMFGTDPSHLDHDPPLAARIKVYRNGIHTDYDPPANSPDHLVYRPALEHRLKTNVRGLHGQHPDRVLIAKNRRLEELEGLREPRKARPKAKIRSANRWPPAGSRKFQNGKR